MTTETGENPYVGPRAFKTGEPFFGRTLETNDLLDLLIARRIVLCYSPSGAGKTSLIQAGLIPRLREENFQDLPVIRVGMEANVPGAGDSTKPAANRYLISAMLSMETQFADDEQLPLPELAALSMEDYLQRRYPLGEKNQVLIFDQFEEVLTASPVDQEAKKLFFQQLGAALQNRSRWALFSIREDYLAAFDPYVIFLPNRFSSAYRLDFLGVDMALEAVQQPAILRKVDFTREAAYQLINDLREVQVQLPDGTICLEPGPYIEPMQLQVACYNLWEKRDPRKGAITKDEISATGSVDRSLQEYYHARVGEAAQSLAERSVAGGAAANADDQERIIREWFDQKLITPNGMRSQVMYEKAGSAGLDNYTIGLLENAHLIRAEKRRGVLWYELAHDRLVRPVRRDNSQWFEEHLHLLQRQSALWQQQGQPDGLLLRGQTLSEAVAWAEANSSSISDTDRTFLRASQQLFEEEERKRKKLLNDLEVEKAWKERLEKAYQVQGTQLNDYVLIAKKERRRRIITLAAMAAALLLIAAAAWVGYNQLKAQQPMTGDSNIAVAEFGTLDTQGNAKSSQEGKEISAFLAKSVEAEIKDFAAGASYELRGPERIGVIKDAQQAAQVAQRINAHLLLYGTIQKLETGQMRYQLNYYLSESSFIEQNSLYKELASQKVLGYPFSVTTGGTQFSSKETAQMIMDAYQRLLAALEGIAYYDTAKYEEARRQLDILINNTHWEERAGKEAAYALSGETYLKLNNPQQAREAFQKAFDLNPRYARASLGLGATAFAEAIQPGASEDEINSKLMEARIRLSEAEDNTKINTNIYVTTAAEYLLGHVYLFGAEHKLSWSSYQEAGEHYQHARQMFEEALQPRELIPQAAGAMMNLGWLRGINGDWEKMAADNREAVNILKNGNINPQTRSMIARAYSYIGFADLRLSKGREAITAFDQATQAACAEPPIPECDAVKKQIEDTKNNGTEMPPTP